MDYVRMLSSASCPYEFSLDDQPGGNCLGKPPYPALTIVSNDSQHMREIRMQTLRVRVFSPEQDHQEDIDVMRLVAVLEGGTEMEIWRQALPASITDQQPVDQTHCAACHREVPPGSGVINDGKIYHEFTCWIDDDNE